MNPNSPNKQQGLDPDVVNLARAIRTKESQGKYDAVGDNGTSKGAYQWQRNTWVQHATEAGLDPNDFSPYNQDMVAYHTIKKMKDSGLNVPQIASTWNGGDPNRWDPNYVTPKGLPSQVPGKYNVPQYANDVNNIYQQLKQQTGGSFQPNTTAIQDQRQEMIANGQAVSVNPNKAEPTTAGGLLRGLLKGTIVEPALSIASGVKALFGGNPETTINTKYLGQVSDIGTEINKASQEIGNRYQQGDITMGGALLRGGLGAPVEKALNLASVMPVEAIGSNIGKSFLGKAVENPTIQKVIQSGVQGASLGAGYGMSGELQNPEATTGSVIGNTLLGGAVGGVTQPALEYGVPAAINKLKGGAEFTKPIFQKAAGVKPDESTLAKYADDIEREYEEAIGFNKPKLKKKARQGAMGQSSDLRTLIEEGALPELDESGRWDVTSAKEKLEELNGVFEEAKGIHTQNEHAWFNLSEALNNVKKDINGTIKSATGRAQANKKLANELRALQAEGIETIKNNKGEIMVKADTMEKLRQAANSWTPFDRNDVEKINSSLGFALGNAIRDNVEKYGTFGSTYRNFNRKWGEVLSAQRFLDDVSGQKMRKKGGLSGEIAKKMLALGAGAKTGGILGAVVSNLGLDTISRVTSDPAFYTYFKKQLVKEYSEAESRGLSGQKLINEVVEKMKSVGSIPQLPESKTIFKGTATPKGTDETIVTKGNVPPKDIEEARLFKRQEQELPKDIEDYLKNNPNISRESVINALKNKGGQSAFGVAAGIKLEKDENGNVTGIGFDPKMAGLGILGAGTIGNQEVREQLAKGAKGLIRKGEGVIKELENPSLYKSKTLILAKDLSGNKIEIKPNTVIKAGQGKGSNMVIEVAGKQYTVNSGQFQNIKGQSISDKANKFAPELDTLEESVKTKSGSTQEDFYRRFDNGEINVQERNNLLDKLGEQKTKYASYTLPGGDNYKEILIKAPGRKGDFTASERIEYEKLLEIEDSPIITKAQQKRLEELDKKNIVSDKVERDFKSSHWDEPNVISHLRMNERTYNGKKVAFMEELQSDWAREARAGKGVPTNENLKNWQELTIKRALKDAVDNNSEYFAWINGEQTSNRYNLATHVDDVKWESTDLGKPIVIKPKDGSPISIRINKEGVIERTGKSDWKGKKLDEVLGKGLADKIMEKESGTLAGDGLKFGGEWAGNLYDKQVKSIVEDLTGAKVKDIDLGLPIDNKKTDKWTLSKRIKLESGGETSIKGDELNTSNLKVGNEIYSSDRGSYIITDILGDGKFKAIKKKYADQIKEQVSSNEQFIRVLKNAKDTEDFDISQKKAVQQGVELTPEIKAIIKGESPLKKERKKLGLPDITYSIPLIFGLLMGTEKLPLLKRKQEEKKPLLRKTPSNQ